MPYNLNEQRVYARKEQGDFKVAETMKENFVIYLI